MPTLQELLAQRDALNKQIAEKREHEIAEAIAKARALISEYELTENDLFGGKRAAKKEGKETGKVAPKYRDTATGATWTGRGKAPRWLDGKDRNQFLIA